MLLQDEGGGGGSSRARHTVSGLVRSQQAAPTVHSASLAGWTFGPQLLKVLLVIPSRLRRKTAGRWQGDVHKNKE